MKNMVWFFSKMDGGLVTLLAMKHMLVRRHIQTLQFAIVVSKCTLITNLIMEMLALRTAAAFSLRQHSPKIQCLTRFCLLIE
jgi:hypothetical protein